MATRSASSACQASAWSCAAARTCARPATSVSLSSSARAVSAGVRRIEALTGDPAVKYVQDLRSAFAQAVAALHVNPDQAVATIEKLQADHKRLEREVTQLKTKLATGAGSAAADDDVVDVQGGELA